MYDRCVCQVRFRMPLNPIRRSRSLAHGYIHRNVIYQTLVCSDRGICPDTDIDRYFDSPQAEVGEMEDQNWAVRLVEGT
jgi:hypothetical protein